MEIWTLDTYNAKTNDAVHLEARLGSRQQFVEGMGAARVRVVTPERGVAVEIYNCRLVRSLHSSNPERMGPPLAPAAELGEDLCFEVGLSHGGCTQRRAIVATPECFFRYVEELARVELSRSRELVETPTAGHVRSVLGYRRPSASDN
ncbi:hypothetical protein DQ392_21620 [Streptomyces reniochalinae]|uniref:Uncharacterized protein n=1 Tax=Streptomyces reniochalinae TaxID=2250578 RepID=A0A367EF77_9ACTN|nr:hypothetical protein DQ392_21620 [Streptomyces reniochalinae]